VKDGMPFRTTDIFMPKVLIEVSECDQLRDQVRKTNLLARMNEHSFFGWLLLCTVCWWNGRKNAM